MRWIVSGLAGLLAACGGEGSDGFAGALDEGPEQGAPGSESDLDEGGSVDGGHDSDDQPAQEDDPEDPDDPGDSEDDLPALNWDALPDDDLPLGTIWVGRFNCSILDGEAELWIERTEDGWTQINRIEDHPATAEIPQTSGVPLGDFSQHCVPDGFEPDRRVDWEPNGSLHFYNGDWDHHLFPTTVPGRWQGTVTPMFEISAECEAEMAEQGIPRPAILQLLHVGTW
jgi:hypothetical protein